MTPTLLEYLCEPITSAELLLKNALYDERGNVVSGTLVSASGSSYPIIEGIPRFVLSKELANSVASFGAEWNYNYFNFIFFKENWLRHTVANTFGELKVMKDKVIVDAGGGSGAQTLWMLEAGAEHVIMLDLSNSVDDVVRKNLSNTNYTNFDVIQCSIDAPPIKARSIGGIVYCHNVIQHTPSVEKTAKALYALVAPGGEFVFNVYAKNDKGLLRWIRFHLIYRLLRALLSRSPFWAILGYAKTMAVLREMPLVGFVLEKSGFLVQGDVPRVEGESVYAHILRRMRATTLNTYDWFGFHKYQHHKSDAEVRALLADLQPDSQKILNVAEYFSQPPPIGCALRVLR